MALAVEKINADTSFILTFTPAVATETAGDQTGSYTILVDPWLVGHCSLWHPAFQISSHTTPCSISSLAELRQPPDMIVVSQDKPDHCHKETLCSMPKSWSTLIVAPQGAARRITSWKHFDPRNIRVLPRFRQDKPETLTVPLPCSDDSQVAPGEVTVAYLQSRKDMTGLHNAIGITYRPPVARSLFSDSITRVTASPLSKESLTPQVRKIRSSSSICASLASSTISSYMSSAFTKSSLRRAPLANSKMVHGLPTPNSSDSEETCALTDEDMGPYAMSRKASSVIYTPHGVSMSALRPYVQQHLLERSAFPPLALFHSMNMETNPWFMGGLVVAGAPNGSRLARELGVRHWFGAHDEIKDSAGIAVKWVKSRRYDDEQIKDMLRGDGGQDTTTIHTPIVGERIFIA